jgi:hypothetical protein
MSTLFVPPPPGSVREALLAYEAYIERRDGAPDFERRTLSSRERETARFEDDLACYDGPFESALFARQLRRYDSSVPTPPEMQLLLCMVKINANEAFAVEQAFGRMDLADDAADRLQRVVLLEEGYHTRLLRSAARVFGVAVAETQRPTSLTRTLVSTILTLPEVASRPVTLASEAIGVATFLRMLGAIGRLFRDRPAVRDALEERVTEVLIDEIGHVSFNRLLAKRGTFASLRALVPAIAMGTRGGMPEADMLGILPVPVRDVWDFDPQTLPDEVRRRAFVA